MLSAMDRWGVTQAVGGWVSLDLALEKLSDSFLTAKCRVNSWKSKTRCLNEPRTSISCCFSCAVSCFALTVLRSPFVFCNSVQSPQICNFLLLPLIFIFLQSLFPLDHSGLLHFTGICQWFQMFVSMCGFVWMSIVVTNTSEIESFQTIRIWDALRNSLSDRSIFPYIVFDFLC